VQWEGEEERRWVDNGKTKRAQRRENPRAQAKAYATSRQRFSGGFGWDKMAGEGLKK
jgi:hypothetical protein